MLHYQHANYLQTHSQPSCCVVRTVTLKQLTFCISDFYVPTPLPITFFAFSKCVCLCVFLGCANPEELTTERAHSAVEEMFETLRGLSHTRDHLKQLRSVYTASDGVHQVEDTQTRLSASKHAHTLCNKDPPQLRSIITAPTAFPSTPNKWTLIIASSWFPSCFIHLFFLHSFCGSNTSPDLAEDLWPSLLLSLSSLRHTVIQHREGVHHESLFINCLLLTAYVTQKGLCESQSFVLMNGSSFSYGQSTVQLRCRCPSTVIGGFFREL